METIRTQDAFGTQSNSKVWVMQEFENSSENHLGNAASQGPRALLPPLTTANLNSPVKTKSITPPRTN
jgi:hypothetical protein